MAEQFFAEEVLITLDAFFNITNVILMEVEDFLIIMRLLKIVCFIEILLLKTVVLFVFVLA